MRERLLSSGGIRIHCYEHGPAQAPGVLLLHGWASSGRMWIEAMQALGEAWHTLAPDLPGHGLSDKPAASWYSLEHFAQTAWEITCSALDCPVAVVGHSMGGAIALQYALDHPDETRGLLLVNSVVTGRLFLDPPSLTRFFPRRVILGLARIFWPVLTRRMRRQLLRRAERGPAYARRNLEDLIETTADSALGSARAATHHDLVDRLQEIRAPTWVVVGTHDSTVPPREGRLAAQRIQGARLIELSANHLASDEQPEEFIRILTGFTQSLSG